MSSCSSRTSPTWLTGARNLQSVLHHHQVALNLPWASLDLPVYFYQRKNKKERIPNNPYPDWHTLYVNINNSYRAIIKETALPLSFTLPPAFIIKEISNIYLNTKYRGLSSPNWLINFYVCYFFTIETIQNYPPPSIRHKIFWFVLVLKPTSTLMDISLWVFQRI